MLFDELIYEKLNDNLSLRGFITASVALFDNAVEQLINRVFRKTDFAVKSVVDSLLTQNGPLFELHIRLKVLVGLGVISHQLFEDLNAFIKFKDFLNNDEKEYAFTDKTVIEFMQSLSFQQEKNLLSLEESATDNPDSLLFQMKRQRQENLIRSCLTLTVSALFEQLQIDSPL